MSTLDDIHHNATQSQRTVAFFDMDKTILAVNSAKLWAMYMWRTKQIRTRDLLKSMSWLARYRMAMVDIEKVTEEVSHHIVGKSEADMAALVRQWYAQEVRQYIIPEVAQLIRSHQQKDHLVVLLTAASPYISAPLSEELALDDFLCTQFEIADGVFTGQLIRPVCYGEGKIFWAKQWCAERDVSMADAYFYTDSFTDLPMLEQVSNPVVINPDGRLRRWATQNDVPVFDYAHQP